MLWKKIISLQSPFGQFVGFVTRLQGTALWRFFHKTVFTKRESAMSLSLFITKICAMKGRLCRHCQIIAWEDSFCFLIKVKCRKIFIFWHIAKFEEEIDAEDYGRANKKSQRYSVWREQNFVVKRQKTNFNGFSPPPPPSPSEKRVQINIKTKFRPQIVRDWKVNTLSFSLPSIRFRSIRTIVVILIDLKIYLRTFSSLPQIFT